jgi:hypothetical protein
MAQKVVFFTDFFMSKSRDFNRFCSPSETKRQWIVTVEKQGQLWYNVVYGRHGQPFS